MFLLPSVVTDEQKIPGLDPLFLYVNLRLIVGDFSMVKRESKKKREGKVQGKSTRELIGLDSCVMCRK